MVRSSDSRQTVVLHTRQKAVTGSRWRVMNCQLRLGLTLLYMTGQFHFRLVREESRREKGGQENVSGKKKQIYGLLVFGVSHMPSLKLAS